MSILLQLKNAAVALSGPLFRTAIIADMATIESEVNNLDIAVNGLTQNVTTSWVSGTTYAINDFRRSPINFQTYRRLTVGAGTVDPSADTTNWVAVAAGNSSQNINVAPATASTHAVQKGQLDGGTGHLLELLDAGFTAQTINAGVVTNISNKLLTVGTWDVSLVAESGNSSTNTFVKIGISLTSAAFTGTEGKDWIYLPCNVTSSTFGGSIPRIRVTIVGSSAQVYGVFQSTVTITTAVSAYISAVRVAL
jgi:hypothetical protein